MLPGSFFLPLLHLPYAWDTCFPGCLAIGKGILEYLLLYIWQLGPMSDDLIEVSSTSRLSGFFPVALSTSRAWLGAKLSLQGISEGLWVS